MFGSEKQPEGISRRGFLKGVAGMGASLLAGEVIAQEKIGNLKELTLQEATDRGMNPEVSKYADVLIDASNLPEFPDRRLRQFFIFFKQNEPEGKRAAFVDEDGNTFVVNKMEGSNIEGYETDVNKDVVPNTIKSTPNSTYDVDVLYFPAVLPSV